MFLRKMTVIVIPLLLCALICILLPLVDKLPFWGYVIGGTLLGAALQFLLPLAGATRQRENFGGLLSVPAVLLYLLILYQYLNSMGYLTLEFLSFLKAGSGETILTESIFASYSLTFCLRTGR